MWVTPFSKISIFIVCDVFWNTASNLINFCFLFPFLFFIIEQYGYGLNVIQDSIGLASVITCHQDVLQSVSLINFQFWIFCKLLDCRFLGRFSVSLNSRGLYEELSLSSKRLLMKLRAFQSIFLINALFFPLSEYTPETRQLFIGQDNGTISQFVLSDDCNRLTPIKEYLAHNGRITELIFAKHSGWILSCGRDKIFSVHCTETGNRIGGYTFEAWCTNLQWVFEWGNGLLKIPFNCSI